MDLTMLMTLGPGVAYSLGWLPHSTSGANAPNYIEFVTNSLYEVSQCD